MRATKALAAWALVLGALPLVGCPAHTDYNGAQRLTDHTAYTLRPGETLLGVGLLEADPAAVFVDIRAEHSFFEGFEAGTNVAHDALAVINGYAKYTFLDSRWVGLGGRVGLTWLNPANVWLLSDEARQDFGDFDAFLVPVALQSSFPLASWVGLHLEVAYTYSGVAGTLGEGAAEAGFGGHELALQPQANFYVGNGVALLAGARWPVWVDTQAEVTSEVEDGVVYGARVSAVNRFPIPYVAVHMAWEHFNLRFGLSYGTRVFNFTFLQFPLPSALVFWRF